MVYHISYVTYSIMWHIIVYGSFPVHSELAVSESNTRHTFRYLSLQHSLRLSMVSLLKCIGSWNYCYNNDHIIHIIGFVLWPIVCETHSMSHKLWPIIYRGFVKWELTLKSTVMILSRTREYQLECQLVAGLLSNILEKGKLASQWPAWFEIVASSLSPYQILSWGEHDSVSINGSSDNSPVWHDEHVRVRDRDPLWKLLAENGRSLAKVGGLESKRAVLWWIFRLYQRDSRKTTLKINFTINWSF